MPPKPTRSLAAQTSVGWRSGLEISSPKKWKNHPTLEVELLRCPMDMLWNVLIVPIQSPHQNIIVIDDPTKSRWSTFFLYPTEPPLIPTIVIPSYPLKKSSWDPQHLPGHGRRPDHHRLQAVPEPAVGDGLRQQGRTQQTSHEAHEVPQVQWEALNSQGLGGLATENCWFLAVSGCFSDDLHKKNWGWEKCDDQTWSWRGFRADLEWW